MENQNKYKPIFRPYPGLKLMDQVREVLSVRRGFAYSLAGEQAIPFGTGPVRKARRNPPSGISLRGGMKFVVLRDFLLHGTGVGSTANR